MVKAAAMALKQPGAALLLGGAGVHARALEWAGRISAATGCHILGEYNSPRIERGAGRVISNRIPYVVDAALKTMADYKSVVLAGGRPPVSFFAYPGKPSLQAPPTCNFTRLAGVEEDIAGALEAVARELGAGALPPAHVAKLDPPGLPTGKITQEGIAAVLGALMPENAIVVDESVSTGRGFATFTTHTQPHDWLCVMGGSIGFGLPSSVGAAIACPDRKVITLEGDGSAMYTLQALWTMARESLPVVALVFANRAYRILQGELQGVGATISGDKARDMLSLDRPALDWVALARGHGVPGTRVEDAAALVQALQRGFASRAPCLVEVVL
jgi:acetolactate synthase-1/2/3 large subunit